MLGGRILLATVLATALAIVGCKSSTSTMFTRGESNNGWCKFEKVAGVPITIKIPTHLKVYVFEKHFLQEDTFGAEKQIQLVDLPIVLRDFSHEFVYTEKVVMVDFKRPAAGAFNLEVDYTEDQYIKKVQHDITDETIARVTEFVDKALPFGSPGTQGAVADEGKDVKKKIMEVRSVAAVGMFEVDAPDFELQVQEFLNCHINKSHDAMSAPPGVKSFHRAPVADIPINNPRLCDECPLQSAYSPPIFPPSDQMYTDLHRNDDYEHLGATSLLHTTQ